MKNTLLTLIAVLVLIGTASISHAQPYANNWTEITDGGDTIYHTWPPPDSIWLHDQIVIKFRRGALDYAQLCYDCDTIVGGALTSDSFMYFPKCKETLMRQEFDTSVILDSTVKAILQAHGVSYLRRMTAANPCANTLSITRFGDTIPMDHFDWMVAHMNNDTGLLATLANLHVPDSCGMELAEPIYLMELAHTPRKPYDPWCVDSPYDPWPYHQIYLDTIDWNNSRWGIDIRPAWGYDVGSTPGHWPQIVSVIDNGIDYWRCDLGGGLGSKVIGGWDFYRDSLSTIYKGTCPLGSDEGDGASNHGTLIAAIIGALTNNEGCLATAGLPNAMAGIGGGYGTVGGATNLGTGVQLVGYNVIDPLSCTPLTQGPRSDWAASAIMESAAGSVSGYYGYGATIINASWYEPPGLVLAIRSGVAEAFRNKVSFVACTGNAGNTELVWPAGIEPASEVTAVGAATVPITGPSAYVPTRATYSNYNHYTDLVAPGGGDGTDQVYALQDDTSDGPTSASIVPDAAMSPPPEGTSFAAPQVAGVIALLRDYLLTGGYMGDPPQEYFFEDVEGILKASALDFGDSATDPWCCPHYAPDNTPYLPGFDEQVGWGLLQVGHMFHMLDPAGLGYKLFHLEVDGTDHKSITYGSWSSKTPIMIYDPSSLGVPHAGKYMAQVREVIGKLSYAWLNLNTSIPVYAWGNSIPKVGWDSIPSVGGAIWSNWQEYWCEVKMDTQTPPRDFGNGIVPGIRHEYSTTLTAHTYQYKLWNSTGTDSLGLYPNDYPGEEVTIFGVPCIGCKIADGHPSILDTAGMDVTVHPNPANSTSKVCVADLPGGIPAVVEVVNQSGEVVATLYDATPDAELGLCLTLDCSKLPSGIYYARVWNAIMGQAVKLSVSH